MNQETSSMNNKIEQNYSTKPEDEETCTVNYTDEDINMGYSKTLK